MRDPPFPDIHDALLARLDQPGPRYTSYPTVPAWTDVMNGASFARVLEERVAPSDAPLSLYVHIPFCRSLCSYCGCNVVVTRDQARVERYLAALGAELALLGRHLGARRRLARVHLGGGTPTFLSPTQLATLWTAITSVFAIEAGAEIAIEVEPNVTSVGQLELLRSFGFNRLSLGVQDFDPDVQAAVHRHQEIATTRRIVTAARQLGYASVNLDLIYGLPRQTPTSWAWTLEEVLELSPDRLAVFSFAYLPALRPNQRRLQVADMPRGRTKLALLEQAYEAFREAGYRAIGIDHFARHDDELARSRDRGTLGRDFQGYTVGRALDTVAAGASAISSIAGVYAQNDKRLGSYEGAISRGELPVDRGLVLSADDLRRRDVILQLMCNDHVDLGADAETAFAPELCALARLEGDGLVQVEGARQVTLTPLGRVFARNVAMVFDAYLGHGATYSRTV